MLNEPNLSFFPGCQITIIILIDIKIFFICVSIIHMYLKCVMESHSSPHYNTKIVCNTRFK